MPLPSRGALGVQVLGFALFLDGCGGDEPNAAVPEEVPTVTISALRTSAGEEWSRSSPDELSPAELQVPCDGRLIASLVFTPTNFSARAPGACGATQLCGHVKVALASEADPQLRAETRAVLGPVLLQLPAPFAGGATLTAGLLLDDGSDYMTLDGSPVGSSLPALFTLPDAGCTQLSEAAPAD